LLRRASLPDEGSPRFAESFAVDAEGFVELRPDAGTESLHTVLATYVSTTGRLSRALKPRRMAIHPNAAPPAMPAAVID